MQYVSSGGHAGCFLCEAVVTDDPEAMLILERGDGCIVILNKYPYNSGHLLVAPERHVGQIDELSSDESMAVMHRTIACVAALRKAMSPHGFNIGANLGSAAGAGVPGHFHMHIVPRWDSDTNFMPVVGEAKVLPEILTETYRRLRPFFPT